MIKFNILPAAAFALVTLGACQTTPNEQEQTQTPAPSTAPCMEGEACRTHFTLNNGLKLAIYRNLPLDKKNAAIKRVVIALHGSSRTAHRYFARATAAAEDLGLTNETLVIAPRFSIAKDEEPRRHAGDLFWDKGTYWKRGDLSTKTMKVRVGSFTAMDELLTFLGNRKFFPNIVKVTLIGHSAGGQFMQRYVAAHPPLPALKGIHIRHIAANPGRYMYLNELRPAPRFDGTFSRPGNIAACNRYDRFEYGLTRLNIYAKAAGKAAMIHRTRKRDFVLLLGDEDIDPEGKGLPRNCRAMMQGRNRLERGLMFKAHLDQFFAPHKMRAVIMPGVSHSGTKLFRSPEARKEIFF